MGPKSADFWREVYAAVLGARDSAALVGVLSRQVEALGFRHWSYGVQFPVSATAPVLALFDRYPAGWMAHYRRSNYVETDPTVRMGRQRCSALVWSDEVFASSDRLWNEARDVGLRVGVAHPSWGPAGSYGLLSVARETEPVSAEELSELELRLKWLAEVAHQKVHSLCFRDLVREADEPLSPRERDVLLWTAEGKTSWETSRILRISERTVNFHIAHILRKLNAQNRVQAAVKAAALGLLHGGPGESRRAARASDRRTPERTRQL